MPYSLFLLPVIDLDLLTFSLFGLHIPLGKHYRSCRSYVRVLIRSIPTPKCLDREMGI